MMSMLDRWVDLPVGAKVACVLVGGGGLSSAAYLLIGDPRVFLFVGLGLALLAGIFVGYRWLLKKRQARKSKPFEDQIANSGGATPREVSDPSRRAQMDSLRKKFDEGLRVYRQRGKDLYSVPWYVVIGEPASGKSAAIRNSGVGFPPGLHGEMQGVGGTINMDWFFTNDAVILDTAGRLAFEEVETAKTTEWKEFLRLLRTARSRCPINGMLIFIPVDSLKNDTADELEQKAKKIAQQLDFVQQTLGVRFPLSVVISKADLLVGFSEFFEGISDPREQYQIFGWSNPKPLDETFQPREIGDALGAIRERVIRRRALLLKEPAPQAMVADRRIDEVDRLFLLPDEIERIAPRLQRYLDLFFAGGQWSAPPPFLRGVYFTSALREGEAVDLALAEAIGMEASDVQEDRAWESKRSFFLHDLFMEKVFRERGLVTSAPSPGRAKRKRLAVLYGAVAAILLAAIGLTVYSGYRFWDDLKKPERDWREVAENVVADDGGAREEIAAFTLEGRDKKPAYWGDKTIEGWKYTPADLADKLGDYIEAYPLRARGLFAVFSKMRLLTDLGSAQQDAQRALLNASVIKPLVSVTSRLLAAGDAGSGWSDQATRAYAELLDAWTLAEGQVPRAGLPVPGESDEGDSEDADGPAAGSDLPIEGMWENFFAALEAGSADSDSAAVDRSTDLKAVKRALDRAYGGSARKAWPPASLGIAGEDIDAATTRFLASWTIERASPTAARLLGVGEKLNAFRTAEDRVLGRDWFANVSTASEYTRARADWNTELANLGTLAEALDEAIGVAGLDLGGDLATLQAEAERELNERVDGEFALVLASLPEGASGEDNPDESAEGITPQGVARRIEAKQETLKSDLLGELQRATEEFEAERKQSLQVVDARARYRWRLEAYQAAAEALEGVFAEDETRPGTLARLDEARSEVEARHTAGVERFTKLLGYGVDSGDEASAMGKDATSACQQVADAGGRYGRYQVASDLLAVLENAEGELSGIVRRGADDGAELPGLSVTVNGVEMDLVQSTSVDPRNAPEGAGRVFDGWLWLDTVTAKREGGPVAVLDQAKLRDLVDDTRPDVRAYAADYLGYWSKDFRDHFEVSSSAAWAESRDMLLGLRAREVNRRLAEIAGRQAAALEKIPTGVLSEDDRGALRMALDAAAGARAAYVDDDFNDRCRDVKREWGRLPGHDATGARRTLLSSPMASFASDYLVHATQDERDDSLGFWDSLIDHLLRALAESASGEFAGVMANTRSVLAQQPFCRDAQTAAQVGSYADVAESVGVILGNTGGGESESFEPGSVGAGRGTTGVDAVDDMLDRLRGAGGKLSSDDRRRLTRVKGLAEWLDLNPSVTMRTLDGGRWPSQSGGSAGAPKYVSLNGSGLQSSTFGAPLGGTLALSDSSRLLFAFATSQSGGTSEGTVSYAEPWGVLKLLWQDGVRPDSGGAGKARQNWIVPVRAEGSGKEIWIGLTFSEPLPFDPEDWPNCNAGN